MSPDRPPGGYPFGDFGRKEWEKLSLTKQKNIIRASLKAAGVKGDNLKAVMKDAFKDATSGKVGARGVGKAKFLRNAIKGAIGMAIIMSPYEVYADQAGVIQAAGQKLVFCRTLQLFTEQHSQTQKLDHTFIYHWQGEDYLTSIVERGGQGQQYVIAKTLRKDGIHWEVPDDLSCPVTCDKTRIKPWPTAPGPTRRRPVPMGPPR